MFCELQGTLFFFLSELSQGHKWAYFVSFYRASA